MRYELQTEGDNPVTLALAKTWLKISHDYEDDLITTITDSAISFAENYTGCSFRAQTWILYASINELYAGITITKSPVTDFTSIVVTLDDDSTVELDNDDYYLGIDATRAYVMLTNTSVMDNAADTYNAVSITFSTNSGLPKHIENALKMIISFMYENRGDAPTINNNPAPPEALKLLQIERVAFV